MIVRALFSTNRGFANAVNRYAIRCKDFAEELVFNQGIRDKITPKALKELAGDYYDKSGRLTEIGKKELLSMIQRFSLPKNATWDQLLPFITGEKPAPAKAEKYLPTTLEQKFAALSKLNFINRIFMMNREKKPTNRRFYSMEEIKSLLQTWQEEDKTPYLRFAWD